MDFQQQIQGTGDNDRHTVGCAYSVGTSPSGRDDTCGLRIRLLQGTHNHMHNVVTAVQVKVPLEMLPLPRCAHAGHSDGRVVRWACSAGGGAVYAHHWQAHQVRELAGLLQHVTGLANTTLAAYTTNCMAVASPFALPLCLPLPPPQPPPLVACVAASSRTPVLSGFAYMTLGYNCAKVSAVSVSSTGLLGTVSRGPFTVCPLHRFCPDVRPERLNWLLNTCGCLAVILKRTDVHLSAESAATLRSCCNETRHSVNHPFPAAESRSQQP